MSENNIIEKYKCEKCDCITFIPTKTSHLLQKKCNNCGSWDLYKVRTNMTEEIDMTFYNDLKEFAESCLSGKYECTNRLKEKEITIKMAKLLNELDLCWVLIHKKHFNKFNKVCIDCRIDSTKNGVRSSDCEHCSEAI